MASKNRTKATKTQQPGDWATMAGQLRLVCGKVDDLCKLTKAVALKSRTHSACTAELQVATAAAVVVATLRSQLMVAEMAYDAAAMAYYSCLTDTP